jgi:hypothetical protein
LLLFPFEFALLEDSNAISLGLLSFWRRDFGRRCGSCTASSIRVSCLLFCECTCMEPAGCRRYRPIWKEPHSIQPPAKSSGESAQHCANAKQMSLRPGPAWSRCGIAVPRLLFCFYVAMSLYFVLVVVFLSSSSSSFSLSPGFLGPSLPKVRPFSVRNGCKNGTAQLFSLTHRKNRCPESSHTSEQGGNNNQQGRGNKQQRKKGQQQHTTQKDHCETARQRGGGSRPKDQSAEPD